MATKHRFFAKNCAEWGTNGAPSAILEGTETTARRIWSQRAYFSSAENFAEVCKSLWQEFETLAKLRVFQKRSNWIT